MYNDVKKLLRHCEHLVLLILLLQCLFFSSNLFAQETATEGGMPAVEEKSLLEQGKELIQGVVDFATEYLNGGEERKQRFREGPPRVEDPLYLNVGTFVVNLKGGKYFLKTTITLIFSDRQPFTWLNMRLAIVKDLIITQLSGLSEKKLRKSRMKQILRNDLKIKINSLFPNNWSDHKPLKKILFQEFYTQ